MNGHGQPLSRRMRAERRRLILALLCSLLFHALLLSLTFGGEALGLPGFGFPWQERRVEAPTLRAVLRPAPGAAAESLPLVTEPSQQPASESPVTDAPALPLAMSPPPGPASTVAAIVSRPQPAAEAKPAPEVAKVAPPTDALLSSGGFGVVAPTQAPLPGPAVIAIERSADAKWLVPAPASPAAPSPETVLPAPRDVADATQARIDAEALEARQQAAQQEAARAEARRIEAVRQEAARVEAARLEAERQQAAQVEAARRERERETERAEKARLAAAQLETQRQETARQEALRAEVARVEAERQEALRKAAAQQDAQRQEAARVEAARQEAARQEVARAEQGRQAAAQQEAQRQEAARVQEEQEEDARRDARRRAMGRILDEEAAQRAAAANAARPSSMLPYSVSTARRGRLWGRTDTNAELVQYAEAWARKIQFNTSFETVRELVKRPHTHPMVTAAIRSDGSVESVTFVLSSNVPEIDDAIRRIVQSHAPYQAFPRGLAREYDVIEIRRTWHFDSAIRLY